MDLTGRTDGNIKVVFPIKKVPCQAMSHDSHVPQVEIKPGDYVHVKVYLLSVPNIINILCTNLSIEPLVPKCPLLKGLTVCIWF